MAIFALAPRSIPNIEMNTYKEAEMKQALCVIWVVVLVLGFSNCATDRLSNEEKEAKELVSGFWECFNERNFAGFDMLVGATYVNRWSAFDELPGSEGLSQFFNDICRGFPGCKWTINSIEVDGEYVSTYWTFSGVHAGNYAGVPSTGNFVTVSGRMVHRVEDGRIQEGWMSWWNWGLKQQIDVIPAV